MLICGRILIVGSGSRNTSALARHINWTVFSTGSCVCQMRFVTVGAKISNARAMVLKNRTYTLRVSRSA